MKNFVEKNGKKVTFICAIVVAVTMLLAVISANGQSDSGLECACGLAEGYSFNVLLLLAYILPIVAVLVNKFVVKAEKIQTIILVAAFLVSAILLFIAPSLIKFEAFGMSISAADAGCDLGLGALIGAIAAILGAAVNGAKLFLK